ncbi:MULTISPECIES: TRAP transporter substrate-binding protein [unclassified Bradyrhizobium]|uniref:TRAP transporter substrate-binding protein n=1 Tax=unclassified Bradyrhizobium TaxID=2631580 RepID=UPI00143E09A1|nr:MULTISPECIES: TRAP transporter substrate-binding protein [unclassified Bradyrhizobium]
MKICTAIVAVVIGLAAAGYAKGADRAVTLRLSYFLPSSHPLQASFQEWVSRVEKASEGTLRVTIFPSAQLGKAFDHYDMARDAITDIALVGPGYQPGRFPIAGAADLPFQYNGGKSGTAAIDSWYRKYAPAEMKDVHFCLGFIQEPATFHSRKKVVEPEDVKGLKVRPPNAVLASLITRLGGTNVAASPQETRELIERGVADGTFVPWGSAVLFSIDRVAKFHIDEKMNAWFGVVVMNATRYEALSALQKSAIDENCNTDAAVALASRWADFEIAGRAKIVGQSGHETVTLTPDQLAAWRKAAAPLTALWSSAVREVGVDPDKAMAELKDSLQKYGAAY